MDSRVVEASGARSVSGLPSRTDPVLGGVGKIRTGRQMMIVPVRLPRFLSLKWKAMLLTSVVLVAVEAEKWLVRRGWLYAP